MQVFNILCVILFVGFGYCQVNNELDKDEIEKQLKENIPGLEGFNASSLPSQDDVERLIKEKCEKNGGGEEAFNALKNQQSELQSCLEAQLNATEIQEEIEESKKTGSMDEVFGKYCRKYPEIYKCIQGVTEKVKPCLDAKEQDTVNKALVLVGELKEFICFKDGDRIAMFIAEGGVECLQSRKDQLEACANKTLGSRIPTDMTINSLPMLVFTERECNDFESVRACFNEELEKCKDSTPANIVDAFFKFLKKHIPCDGLAKQSASTEPNWASSTRISFSIVIMSILFAKFL